MTFVPSRLFGLGIIALAIAVIIVLWIQCSGNGCAFVAVQQATPTPMPTGMSGFGTNEIRIADLAQGDPLQSPVTITGQAIPDWYIGGVFTVRLLDGEGHGLAYAVAKPVSTTPVNGFISFSASFAFFPHTPNGTLLFEKNLGSGLPDFPSTVALPVTFPSYVEVTPTPLPTVTPTPVPTASATPVTTGILKGTMTISPVCAVSQSGKPCSPSVKMFADRPISVSRTDQAAAVITIIPGPTGEFVQELPAGQYYVSMNAQIMGSITGVPTTVKITAGKTTTLNIAVETVIQTPENTSTAPDGF